MNEDENFSIEHIRAKWAEEVGRFVMAFGSIEGHTYAALRHCPRDPIAETLNSANLSLQPRIDLLVAIAGSRDGTRWQSFGAVLREVKSLAKKRNLIAHNGVGLDIFIDASGEYFVEEGISNAKAKHSKDKAAAAKNRVEFDELVQHRKDAEALDKKLLDALFKVLELIGAEQNGDTAFVDLRKSR